MAEGRSEEDRVWAGAIAPRVAWHAFWLALGRVLAIAVGLAPQASQAADQLTLVWDAPSECPRVEAVRSLIDVHASAARRVNGALHVEGHITREGSRYRLALRLRSPSGEAWRSVNAEQCGGMAEVAALLVAMALDPRSEILTDEPMPQAQQDAATASTNDTEASSTLGPNASESAPPPASTTHTSDAPAAAPPSAPAAEEPALASGPSHRIAVAVTANASMETGMLSSVPGVGFEPQLELRYGVLRADAGLGLWLSGQHAVEEYPRAAVASRALIGQFSLAFELFESPLTLLPRAVFERGMIFLEASGITDGTSDDAVWTAAGGGVQINYALSHRFEVSVTVLALAPFSRPRGQIMAETGAHEVFASARVSGRLSLGLHYVIR